MPLEFVKPGRHSLQPQPWMQGVPASAETKHARGCVNESSPFHRRGIGGCAALLRPAMATPALSAAALRRAYSPDHIEPRLANFVARARCGSELLQIVVLGGSWTKGADCVRGAYQRDWSAQAQCAWPWRLQQWLDQAFPRQIVKVINAAEGAMASDVWARRNLSADKRFLEADLIIGEFGINEFAYNSEKRLAKVNAVLLSALVNLPKRPAVLVLEVTKGAFMDTPNVSRKECENTCEGGQFLSFQTPAMPADNQWQCFCDQWWLPPTWRQPVLRELGSVSAVSLRDAIWPTMREPPSNLPILWQGHAHTNGITHQLAANTLAYAMAAVWDHIWDQIWLNSGKMRHEDITQGRDITRVACTQATQLSSKIDLRPRYANVSLADHCETAVTRLQPPLNSFPASRAGAWWFGEDVPGNDKPGWNTNVSLTLASHTGGVLEFPVQLDTKRLVIVTYLRSYDANMASVQMRLVRRLTHRTFRQEWTEDSWELDGRWSRHISVPHVDVRRVPEFSPLDPGTPLHEEILLRVELLRTKSYQQQLASRFKLLGVTTC